MNAIDIENLWCSFQRSDFQLESINLSVQRGEFVVLAGANGSGKSTLIKHLNGLLKPNRGSIKIKGMEVQSNLRSVRKLVGMVFQNADTQIVAETVRGDIAFGLENLKLPRPLIKSKTEEIAEAVGLSDKLEVHPISLSGGEKKKLVIAGILVMDPEILVFDEPFSNLDYPSIQQILGQILRLQQMGLTILVVTHELEQVLAHANRLIIMSEGKIVLDDRPENIVTQTESFSVREPCSVKLSAGIRDWINFQPTVDRVSS
ncbi:MAG: ABC transporter ATP-binding protein [Proteobacteria bacterium]|nr:ABC transporter ATP-binding protein [Pseudomonadota bacterium]